MFLYSQMTRYCCPLFFSDVFFLISTLIDYRLRMYIVRIRIFIFSIQKKNCSSFFFEQTNKPPSMIYYNRIYSEDFFFTAAANKWRNTTTKNRHIKNNDDDDDYFGQNMANIDERKAGKKNSNYPHHFFPVVCFFSFYACFIFFF